MPRKPKTTKPVETDDDDDFEDDDSSQEESSSSDSLDSNDGRFCSKSTTKRPKPKPPQKQKTPKTAKKRGSTVI